MTIYDIDFSYPHDTFMNELRDFLKNWGNYNMIANSVENATKNGKYMYKIEVSTPDDPNVTTVLFEKNPNNGDIIFAPTSLRSFGGTFYKTENLTSDIKDTDEDTSNALVAFLKDVAFRAHGKFICKTNNAITCVINGNSKEAKECIVDSNGNVYGAKKINSTSLLDGDNVCESFNTQIGEWNKQRKLEDPDFADMLNDKTVSSNDKMYYIGKYVVGLKANNEIEAEEFRDVFIQAGLFTTGFSNDKTLNMIYKLLK